MKKLHIEQDGEQQQDDSEYYDALQTPYIAGFSEKLAEDLRNLNIGVTFQKGTTLYKSFCKLKPPRSPDE